MDSHPYRALHLNLPISLHSEVMRLSRALNVPASRFVIGLLSNSASDFSQMADAAESLKSLTADNLHDVRALLNKRAPRASRVARELHTF